MKSFEIGEHRHDVGETYYSGLWSKSDILTGPEGYGPTIASIILRRLPRIIPNFEQLIHTRTEETGFAEFRFLHAHGRTSNPDRNWEYEDEVGEHHPIQEWIKNYDGTTSALIITCCNPDNLEVSSERSLLIHSRKIYTLMGLLLDPTLLRVRVPEQDYLN